MKTTTVYYSFAGNNEALVQNLKERLGCDAVRIQTVKKRTSAQKITEYLKATVLREPTAVEELWVNDLLRQEQKDKIRFTTPYGLREMTGRSSILRSTPLYMLWPFQLPGAFQLVSDERFLGSCMG